MLRVKISRRALREITAPRRVNGDVHNVLTPEKKIQIRRGNDGHTLTWAV